MPSTHFTHIIRIYTYIWRVIYLSCILPYTILTHVCTHTCKHYSMDHIITLPPPGPLQRHLLILHYSYTLLRSFIDRAQVEEIGRVLLQYHDQIPGKDSPVPVPHIPPVQVDVPIVSSDSDGKRAKGVKGRMSTRSTTAATTAATATTAAAEEEGSYTYSDDTTSHPIAPPSVSILSLLSFTDTTTTASNNSSNSGRSNSNSSNTIGSSNVWAASYCINRLIATSEGWSSREIIKLIHNIQVRVLSMSSDRYDILICALFWLIFVYVCIVYTQYCLCVYMIYAFIFPYFPFNLT